MTQPEAKKTKKSNYKPILLDVAKTVSYSILTGFCMALGGHAYSGLMKPQRGKLVSINGGKTSTAI